jgi:hypothetical protein
LQRQGKQSAKIACGGVQFILDPQQLITGQPNIREVICTTK